MKRFVLWDNLQLNCDCQQNTGTINNEPFYYLWEMGNYKMMYMVGTNHHEVNKEIMNYIIIQLEA